VQRSLGEGIDAMADLNRVFLMGRLTFDPELRRTPGGTAVTELRLATSRAWQSRDGDRREETLFVDVTVWDRQAENCCQFLRKGSTVHVEGSLKMDTWEDKNTGEKRSKIRVHADRVQFLDSRRSDSTAGGGGGPDDDLSGSPEPPRDTGRRGGSTSTRGATAGSSEPRGHTNGAGASGSSAASAPGLDDVAGGEDAAEDDVPF
jgi:single-strand DNA-binding protein